MASQSREPEKKALDFLSQALRSSASAAARRKTAEARLAAIGSGLSSLGEKLLALDVRARSGHTDALAARALDASSGVTALRRVKPADLVAGVAAAQDASAGLDGLAGELVRAADSIRLSGPCGCDGDDDLPPAAEVDRIKDEIGNAAAEVHLAAVALRDVYSLNTDTGWGFRLPVKGGIRCTRGIEPAPEPARGDARGERRPTIVDARLFADRPVDRERLADALGAMDQAVERLPQVLLSLAAFLSTLPAISLCRSACTPPLSYIGAPTVYDFGAESPNGDGLWTPYFTLEWSYCCQDLCLIIFTDEYLISVFSEHRIFGPGIPFVLDKVRAEKLAKITADSLVATIAAGGVARVAAPNRLDVPVTQPKAPACVGFLFHSPAF